MSDRTAVYEGLFLLDANRFARDRDAASRQVEELVQGIEGEVLASRLWEERRLAYPIKGQRKGAYWLMYFRAPTHRITELTRQCEINDLLLRQLFVKLPPSLVDPIIAHAKGETEEPAEEADANVAEGKAEKEPVAAGAE